MITARSSVVHMPPGHYDKIAQVIRHIIKRHSGYKWHTGKYRQPPKRTRPSQRIGKHQVPKSKRDHQRLVDEWQHTMEDKDPDGLQELWSR